MRIDMWSIDALADAHYAHADPQYEDDRRRCDGCGGIFAIDELTERGDYFYCQECMEYEEVEEEDETEY